MTKLFSLIALALLTTGCGGGGPDIEPINSCVYKREFLACASIIQKGSDESCQDFAARKALGNKEQCP